MNRAIRPTASRRSLLAVASLVIVASCLTGANSCESEPADARATVAPASLRHPPAGSVVGSTGRYGGYAWRGIPYAAPPLRENRFRAPVPIRRWQGTHEALAFGASCPQYATPMGGDSSAPEGELVGSEDCLFLNVYAPETKSGAPPPKQRERPVMFWIHGGGNLNGTSAFYNGSRLAAEQQVVVVTLNYRLGFLGWFRHRALRDGVDPIDASGNFGTLDLIRALDWVQENIAAFGGDPGNVTIFGESAGGWNVVSLLASPLATGKFHRAIAQSSLTWSTSPARAENYVDDRPDRRADGLASPHAESRESGEEWSSGEVLINLLTADARASDRESAKAAISEMDDRTLSSYLRNKTVAELFAAYDPKSVGDYTCPRLFEDGVVLPATPLGHAFRPGSRFNRVPVILGTNKDEEKLFLLFDREYTSQLFGFIPRLRDRDRFLRDAETITRIWRMMAVDELAADLSHSMPGQVFSYRFDWDEEPGMLWIDVGEVLGAAHGFEIPFVFGHWQFGPDTDRLFDETNRPGRESLSADMMSYWTHFAEHGRPGKGRDGRLPEWEAWSQGSERFAILDTQEGGGIRMTQGSETAHDIAASILADSSYRDQRRRCMALAAIYDWAPLTFSPRDYAEVGQGLCREFPIRELIESF